MGSRGVAYDAVWEIPPDLVGKVQLVGVQYCVLVQRQDGISLDVLVGIESLGYARSVLTRATRYDVHWNVAGRRPTFPRRNGPIAGP